MKSLYLVILALFFPSYLIAQSDSTELPIVSRHDKNAVYGNVGSLLLIWTATVNYERKFLSNKYTTRKKQKDIQVSPFVRVGYGGDQDLLGSDWSFMTGQVGVLVGGRSSFFEASVGAFYYPGYTTSSGLERTINLGYRNQKQGSRFIFRTGISLHEMVYFGFGFSF